MPRFSGTMNPPHRVLLSFAAVVALALAAAPGMPARADEPPPAPHPCPAVMPTPVPTDLPIGTERWLVSVTSSGGMTGFGDGRFSARSDGTIWRDGCIAHLGAADLKTLDSLVAATHEDRWAPAYGHDDCCDQISMTMKLVRNYGDRATDSHASTTASASFATAPDDYRRLFKAVDDMTRRWGAMERRFPPHATPSP